MSASTMHADERPIDAALVRRLLAAQFPRWAGLPIERFASSGTVNALFRLGDDLAVRLPRIAGGAGDVEREHHWLPRLAPALPVPIPAVLGRGAPGDGFPWPWTVHRWLDGENPREGRVARPGALAADLAEFIVALRRIGPADGPPAYRGGPLREVDEETRTAIGLLRGPAGAIDTDAATAAWEEALAAPGWDGPPVWVHSDLMPGNLLVADGRLSAVIDFGTAGVGDPACDLVPAWNLLPASVRTDFRAALGVDDATWARGRGWALSMALIQLPYYRETNPAMAANARHVIDQVLCQRNV
ncbi:aminoglycoside phosphotransferase family protein [Streptomyces sp. DSM 41524]|uniref:Aminoglycoside phosphotransferase family protein n=1 Tax=Streptomyces asiaticus subsp. ignotus TaxID=3098222 RepID=A0ABU7PRL3_9ACTN|nr:aminoglycoside phosphotransferase family protein [Streptomyces sp. DSM 41524]